MLCLAERSSPEQMKSIREEASTSSTALSKSAEPKEAEIVQEGKEPREEHYNPVMWCLPCLSSICVADFLRAVAICNAAWSAGLHRLFKRREQVLG